MKNKNVYIIGFGYLGLPLAFVIDHRSHITDYTLHITRYRSRITHYAARFTHHAPPTPCPKSLIKACRKTFLHAKTFTKKCLRYSKRHGYNFHRHDYWHAPWLCRQSYYRQIHNTNRIRYLFSDIGFNKHLCYNLHSWTPRRLNQIHCIILCSFYFKSEFCGSLWI